MSAVFHTVTIEYANDSIAGLRNRLSQNSGSSKSKATVLRRFMGDVRALLGAVMRGFVRTQSASACASQLITVAQASGVDNTSTLVIGGTTLTEKAAPSTESQYAKGASDTTLRDNLVACINAHSVLSKYVRAKALAANTFTITCLVPGLLGNFVLLSAADVSVVVGGGGLALENGASDAMYGFSFGYVPST